MMETPELKQMNYYTDTVRAAQLICQYGVGGMVNFPSQTLMTASPEYWPGVSKIHDVRLEKRLHVDYFGMPAVQASDDEENNNKNVYVAYARFPEWYFCSKCHEFKPIREWVKEYKKSRNYREKDPDMTKRLKCPKCGFPDLIPASLVTICRNGHINDFPWIAWAHKNKYENGKYCNNPKLNIYTQSKGGYGFSNILVECENCKAKANLEGVMNYDVADRNSWFVCQGGHPWMGKQESCGEKPFVKMRGASSVYYPFDISSLVIPPYTTNLVARIENSNAYEENLRDKERYEQRGRAIDDIIEDASKDIAKEIGGVQPEKIKALLEKRWLENDTDTEDDSQQDIRFREEEYEALIGNAAGSAEPSRDFYREEMDLPKYSKLPFLKQVVLLHKLREVRVLTGFSRLEPVASMRDPRFVSIKEYTTNWYPGYETRGEGIFLRLDEQQILAWEQAFPALLDRAEKLSENYGKTFYAEQRPRQITVKFLLLHSLAHILIRQLSFECGYSIASLRERIYCDDGTESRKDMSGILIYTASGDSEGTMGGLVQQGYSDSLCNIFQRAIESARYCANDPVCNLSQGQGKDALNLAACHACMLLPETSCEEFNSFLDRGVLIGTLDQPNMGFFSKGYDSFVGVVPIEPVSTMKQTFKQKLAVRKRLAQIEIVEEGASYKGNNPDEVWDTLLEDDNSPLLHKIKAETKSNGISFIQPCYYGCQLKNKKTGEKIEVPLYFPKTKTMLFLTEYQEEYQKAMKTEGHCYYVADDFDVAQFLKEIEV